jgi:plasmid maintenance system antidote protein VapI
MFDKRDRQEFKSPGGLIQEWINNRKLTIDEFAKLIPCTPLIILAIILEDHPITDMMAKKLEKITGKSASQWLERDRIYQESVIDPVMRIIISRIDELG